jgi:hypothetical protein
MRKERENESKQERKERRENEKEKESARALHLDSMLISHLRAENAFICNHSSHWLTLRKIGGHWWDLNSLLDQPRWIGPLYLGMYLQALRDVRSLLLWLSLIFVWS